MQKIILFLDNTSTFLETNSRILEAKNFTVIPASTIETARKLIVSRRIHLGIFDIRIEDEDDHKDTSGLELAKEKEFQYLPKIILTAYPSYEYVRDALGTQADSEPAAINFIGKDEGVQKLLEAIETAFEKHVRINEKLVFEWQSPGLISFSQLTAIINPFVGLQFFEDLVGAYEDLFRKLFYDYKQVTISRLLWSEDGRAALEITAFNDSEENFIITLGPRKKIQSEREKFQKTVNPNNGIVILSQILDSQLVSANAWCFPGAKLTDSLSFPDFFIRQTDKPLRLAIEDFFVEKLARWRNVLVFNNQKENIYPFEPFAEFKDQKESLKVWQKILKHVVSEIKQSDLFELCIDEKQLIFRFANKKSLSLPDPVAYVLENELWKPGNDNHSMVLLIDNLERLLVSSESKTFVTDFDEIYFADPFQEFISFEAGLRFRLVDTYNLLDLYDFEKQLTETRSLNQNINSGNVEPDFRKILSAILVVRQLAAESLGNNLSVYNKLNLLYNLPKLLSVNPQLRQTEKQTRQWLHGLLFLGLLCKQIDSSGKDNQGIKESNLPSGIRIDHNRREVWVDGVLVSLSQKEFSLLDYFVKHKGQICTYDDLIEEVLGYEVKIGKSERSLLSNHILRLRKKIEPDFQNPRYLVNVPGAGYRLEE